MKLVIEIPKEFECDWNRDKFHECFSRVLADLQNASCASGRYEKETIKMLASAFRDAKEYGPKEGDEYVLNRYLILLGPRLIICFLQYTHFMFSSYKHSYFSR